MKTNASHGGIILAICLCCLPLLSFASNNRFNNCNTDLKADPCIYKHLNDITVISTSGTGRTTGHIATLTVKNNSDISARLEPQCFYIPATGKYQSYVGRIGENEYLPPNSTSEIPVHGYCADPFKPPVPLGEDMTDFSEWIPGHEFPVDGDDPQVPEPMNPPQGSKRPGETSDFIPPAEPVIRLSSKKPLPAFDPLVLPAMDTENEDTRLSEKGYYPTFPGTETVVTHKIDLEKETETYVPIVIAALVKIEESAESVQELPDFNTPFSPDEEKEKEALIQQAFWIYMSLVTDGDYDKETYEENVHEQLEDVTGVTYEEMDDDGKADIDAGTSSFWNAYTAVGLEAKVISADSPDIDTSAPGMSDILATVSTPGCECDSISYELRVRRNEITVHSETHTNRNSPSIKVENLKYGDEFEVKLSAITAHCQCEGTECEFYKPQSDNKSKPGYIKTDTDSPGKVEIQMGNDDARTISENSNCQNDDKGWNSDEDEYSFDLITRDERTNEKAIFQRLTIRAYCELEDCRRKLCKKTIQLNFVKK